MSSRANAGSDVLTRATANRSRGGARLQLRACRVEVDTLEYEIEHGPSPTRAGGGDHHGPEAA